MMERIEEFAKALCAQDEEDPRLYEHVQSENMHELKMQMSFSMTNGRNTAERRCQKMFAAILQ
jgi:hypothetical protein